MKHKGRVKTPMNAHTPKTQLGMGDYYGTGVKQKIGRVREDFMGMLDMPPKKLSTPPRQVV